MWLVPLAKCLTITKRNRLNVFTIGFHKKHLKTELLHNMKLMLKNHDTFHKSPLLQVILNLQQLIEPCNQNFIQIRKVKLLR